MNLTALARLRTDAKIREVGEILKWLNLGQRHRLSEVP